MIDFSTLVDWGYWFKLLVLWGIPCIIIHEAGHYLMFMANGVKRPKMELHWWGVSIGKPEYTFMYSPLDNVSICIGGILTGAIYTKVLFPEFWLVYIFMCAIDLLQVYVGITWAFKYKLKYSYGDTNILENQDTIKEFTELRKNIPEEKLYKPKVRKNAIQQ